MANTNIPPFINPTLTNSVTALQNETPLVTYYRTGTATTDPTTTAVVLLDHTIVYPIDRPHEIKLEAYVSLLSNLAGDQEFTFSIYDVDDAAAPYTFGAIDIPNALNTAIGVIVEWTARTTNATNTQWIQCGQLTLVSIDGQATTAIVMPTNPVEFETAEDAIKNFQLRVTAETGTATTTVRLLSGKVTLDTNAPSWN